MKNGFKILITFIIATFLHVYCVGAGSYLFLRVDAANWQKEGQVSAAIENWKSRYLDPRDAISHIVHPNTAMQKKTTKWVLYSSPITILFVWFFSWGYRMRSSSFKDKSSYGSHGSARWAKWWEIYRRGELTGNRYNELRLTKLNSGIIIGYPMNWIAKMRRMYITIPPDSEINQNILILGGSGSGKDLTFIKPQIFNTVIPFKPTGKRLESAQNRLIPTEYSLLIVDVKGEAFRDTSDFLKKNGYEVFTFNLVNMQSSYRWNPLDYVEDDLAAMKTANLLVNNEKSAQSNADPLWEKAERALMTAFILFVKYELPYEQQNVPNILHIATTYSSESELELLFSSLPYNHPAQANFKIFKMAEDKTRASILIGFGAGLLMFANRQIAELTSQSDFRFDDMAKKKTALFMIIPDGDTTFSSITSLFFSQAMQKWWDVAEENNGTCPVGIRIIGNELANIGKINGLSTRMGVMRSKGVSIQIYLQSVTQLHNLYDKLAEDIISHCDTKVFLGTNDMKTAEMMEKDLGDMTIQTESVSAQDTAMIMAPQNVSKQYSARKLRTASEIKKNSRLRNIIVQNASHPFETLKTKFFHHPLAAAGGYDKVQAKDVKPPAHQGFDLFSKSDYDRICGIEDAGEQIQLGHDMQFSALEGLEELYGQTNDQSVGNELLNELLSAAKHVDDYDDSDHFIIPVANPSNETVQREENPLANVDSMNSAAVSVQQANDSVDKELQFLFGSMPSTESEQSVGDNELNSIVQQFNEQSDTINSIDELQNLFEPTPPAEGKQSVDDNELEAILKQFHDDDED